MNGTVLFVLAIVLVAWIFDFLNGFHDSSNSIATVVSTRVLSPGAAVVWAAAFNFVAVFAFGTAVANTIGAGMIHLDLNGVRVVTFTVLFSALSARLPGTCSPGISACRPAPPTRSSAATRARPSPRPASA